MYVARELCNFIAILEQLSFIAEINQVLGMRNLKVTNFELGSFDLQKKQ